MIEALDGLKSFARYDGNLLAGGHLRGAAAGATLGEISAALEEVFGRHHAVTRVISGVYARIL